MTSCESGGKELPFYTHPGDTEDLLGKGRRQDATSRVTTHDRWRVKLYLRSYQCFIYLDLSLINRVAGKIEYSV
jgi:hypothetical protein